MSNFCHWVLWIRVKIVIEASRKKKYTWLSFSGIFQRKKWPRTIFWILMVKDKLQGRIQVKTSSHSVIHRDLNPPKSVPFFDKVAIATSFIFSVLPVPPAFLISHPKIRRGCTQMNRTIVTDCLLQSCFFLWSVISPSFPTSLTPWLDAAVFRRPGQFNWLPLTKFVFLVLYLQVPRFKKWKGMRRQMQSVVCTLLVTSFCLHC